MRIPFTPSAFAALLWLLLSGAVEASGPCGLPQVTMSPPTNSTGVSEPIVLEAARSVIERGALDGLVEVRDDEGRRVEARIDAVDGGYPRAMITGLAPGWYTIHIAVPPDGIESSDRSLWPAAGGFEGEVLMGTSAPALAMLGRCTQGPTGYVIVRWSEPVVFDGDPAAAIEFTVDAGAFTCQLDPWATPDGGFGSTPIQSLRLSCPDAGSIESVRVLAPPRSLDGGRAVFPPTGEAWATTRWARDSATSGPYGCEFWQPSIRRATHENLSPEGLAQSYGKCRNEQGCGCTASANLALWFMLLLPLAFWIRRRAR